MGTTDHLPQTILGCSPFRFHVALSASALNYLPQSMRWTRVWPQTRGWGLVHNYQICLILSLFLSLSLLLSLSNKAVCSTFPALPTEREREREISLWTSKRLQLGHCKTLQSARAQSLVWDTSLLSPPKSLPLCQQPRSSASSPSPPVWYQWN